MEAPLANKLAAPLALEIAALTRRFDDFVAVDHATLSVPQGELFGLIGPNGAGKSTLIKMLTTLLPPTSGTALVGGFDIVRQSKDVRRHIGYVPQLLSADGSLTGFENMLLSARLYGIPRGEQRPRIAEALATMGLSEAAGHLVGRYSGGMIRRLEIAQGMLHHPTVLFMDEPTVGLDPAARETVWEHVVSLARTFHTTMVITTHYMEEADEFCDRIGLIARGRIRAVGTPSELKAGAGPDATLDDVFETLVDVSPESEAGKNYDEVRRARRAAREHG